RLLTLEKEDAALTVGVGDVAALREQLLRLVRSPGLKTATREQQEPARE
ncbi:MAG: MarR family transcriptional regulator, partial [Rhodococcus sp. (in: high G+C Gram-positive bacteria)]